VDADAALSLCATSDSGTAFEWTARSVSQWRLAAVIGSGAVRCPRHPGRHATPIVAATASRMTATIAAGWEMKTACEAP
jgi:hypothetical protein